MIFRAAVLLAAGRGARMGGPKARLLVEDRPLLLHHLGRLSEVGVTEVVVVIHPGEAAHVVPAGARVVFSEEPDPAGSLSRGVSALRLKDDEALLVTPVDAVPPTLAVYAALARALEGARAAAPVFEGRGGHPVACFFSELAPYRSGGLDGPYPLLRDVLRDRARVPVEDASILRDLDTPEDVRALTGRLPVFADRVR